MSTLMTDKDALQITAGNFNFRKSNSIDDDDDDDIDEDDD
ncbi:hypothetical protein A2U01_0058851 [Trifolium medium]|uniref:Uncharacterized protein n=1 Tax=Trifolium medium TaxID=97028 RepID=A0A392RMY1_9FABA|nr:hypothetical protein [Trifolium medium]